MKNKSISAAQRPHNVGTSRRMVLFGLPAVGAALAAVTRPGTAHKSASPPTEADDKYQPVYRETELVRRYYKLARR